MRHLDSNLTTTISSTSLQYAISSIQTTKKQLIFTKDSSKEKQKRISIFYYQYAIRRLIVFNKQNKYLKNAFKNSQNITKLIFIEENCILKWRNSNQHYKISKKLSALILKNK